MKKTFSLFIFLNICLTEVSTQLHGKCLANDFYLRTRAFDERRMALSSNERRLGNNRLNYGRTNEELVRVNAKGGIKEIINNLSIRELIIAYYECQAIAIAISNNRGGDLMSGEYQLLYNRYPTVLPPSPLQLYETVQQAGGLPRFRSAIRQKWLDEIQKKYDEEKRKFEEDVHRIKLFFKEVGIDKEDENVIAAVVEGDYGFLQGYLVRFRPEPEISKLRLLTFLSQLTYLSQARHKEVREEFENYLNKILSLQLKREGYSEDSAEWSDEMKERRHELNTRVRYIYEKIKTKADSLSPEDVVNLYEDREHRDNLLYYSKISPKAETLILNTLRLRDWDSDLMLLIGDILAEHMLDWPRKDNITYEGYDKEENIGKYFSEGSPFDYGNKEAVSDTFEVLNEMSEQGDTNAQETRFKIAAYRLFSDLINMARRKNIKLNVRINRDPTGWHIMADYKKLAGRVLEKIEAIPSAILWRARYPIDISFKRGTNILRGETKIIGGRIKIVFSTKYRRNNIENNIPNNMLMRTTVHEIIGHGIAWAVLRGERFALSPDDWRYISEEGGFIGLLDLGFFEFRNIDELSSQIVVHTPPEGFIIEHNNNKINYISQERYEELSLNQQRLIQNSAEDNNIKLRLYRASDHSSHINTDPKELLAEIVSHSRVKHEYPYYHGPYQTILDLLQKSGSVLHSGYPVAVRDGRPVYEIYVFSPEKGPDVKLEVGKTPLDTIGIDDLELTQSAI